MSMMQNYLSIDPGDRWVGIATLHRRPIEIKTDVTPERVPSRWRFGACVIDRKEQRLIDTMEEIRRIVDKTHADQLIVENYQLRTQGYNAFASSQTLKLIGALELASQSFMQMPLFFVQPDSADLAQLFWRHRWTEIRGIVDRHVPREARAHAYSAWRVLGKHMIVHDVLTLQLIHRES